ncbi:hypothetical protein [Sphingomonas sp. 28-62-20]|uniref:hypothetical protein n=1 Tax=Sphingomonas sp. 28-62-20 TaxID=1970433 RepID=UPI0026C62E7A
MIVQYVQLLPTSIGASPSERSRRAAWCSMIAEAQTPKAIINDFAAEVIDS